MTVNWSQVLKRCRPDVHKKIMETRGRHEELRRLIAETKASLPSIDFGKYKAALPSSAHGFVQEQEKLLSAFQIKSIDTKPLLQSLDAERAAKVKPVLLDDPSFPVDVRGHGLP